MTSTAVGYIELKSRQAGSRPVAVQEHENKIMCPVCGQFRCSWWYNRIREDRAGEVLKDMLAGIFQGDGAYMGGEQENYYQSRKTAWERMQEMKKQFNTAAFEEAQVVPKGWYKVKDQDEDKAAAPIEFKPASEMYFNGLQYQKLTLQDVRNAWISLNESIGKASWNKLPPFFNPNSPGIGVDPYRFMDDAITGTLSVTLRPQATNPVLSVEFMQQQMQTMKEEIKKELGIGIPRNKKIKNKKRKKR